MLAAPWCCRLRVSQWPVHRSSSDRRRDVWKSPVVTGTAEWANLQTPCRCSSQSRCATRRHPGTPPCRTVPSTLCAPLGSACALHRPTASRSSSAHPPPRSALSLGRAAPHLPLWPAKIALSRARTRRGKPSRPAEQSTYWLLFTGPLQPIVSLPRCHFCCCCSLQNVQRPACESKCCALVIQWCAISQMHAHMPMEMGRRGKGSNLL